MIGIGIDPGKSGGIAYIAEGKAVTIPYSNEDLIKTIHDISFNYPYEYNLRVCLEKVSAMPKQGVVSVFTFGKAAGFIEGVLQALSVPYQLIRPQDWKKEFGLNSNKQDSIDVCKKLFPGINLLATPRCKKAHDGMAEALLMAEYARRKL